MPYYAPPVNQAPVLRGVALSLAATSDKLAAQEIRFDVTRRHIPSELVVGETVYSLRGKLVGTFFPGHIGEDGEFIVPEFFPEFVGRGRHINDAFLNWRNEVHCRFQELYSKRPFEMTEPEKASWQLLESLIDVPVYRTTTPLTVRQVGKVACARPLPSLIEWEDGHKEEIRLEQMPGEFAAYKHGQPFEAVVSRDPIDFRLIKVTHVHRTKSPSRATQEAIGTFLRTIKTSDSLPDADWD